MLTVWQGYKYAGAQYQHECYCGNKYGSYGKATNCDMPCAGDYKIKCGGNMANTIMATGKTGLLKQSGLG